MSLMITLKKQWDSCKCVHCGVINRIVFPQGWLLAFQLEEPSQCCALINYITQPGNWWRGSGEPCLVMIPFSVSAHLVQLEQYVAIQANEAFEGIVLCVHFLPCTVSRGVYCLLLRMQVT